MMRRDALVSLPDSLQSLLSSDWAMWVYASLQGPWLCFPTVMAARRVHDGGIWSSLSSAAKLTKQVEVMHNFTEGLPPPFSAIARKRLTQMHPQMHLAALEEALACDRSVDAHRELREILRLLPYCRMGDGKRLVSASWRTLSPRTHGVAKRTLSLIRQIRTAEEN